METEHRLAWSNIKVNVEDKTLLDNVSGKVNAGKVMALMGPSGSGKTTLLNYLGGRNYGSYTTGGDIVYNGGVISSKSLQKVARFIEQEDHLIGSLTVFEMVDFAAKLSYFEANSLVRKEKVLDVITILGLAGQRDSIVGTPLKKGLSGGQKRRLSIACELVTHPQVLFLDEPTSGLDSKASFEVVAALKRIASVENIAVIASIHQPSVSTYNLFDDVMFLTGGKTVYQGTRENVQSYFQGLGFEFQQHQNIPEFVLDLINTDFDQLVLEFESHSDSDSNVNSEQESQAQIVDRICTEWLNHEEKLEYSSDSAKLFIPKSFKKCLWCYQTRVLLHRSLLKSVRDFLAYYVRIVMYLGLAVMMGTVWLRLGSDQKNIQPYINAIFFSGAFMSFMSVAYIPAYLEDYQSYKREKANGLYGPLPFVLSNFIVSIPFLFITTILFSVVTYFLCNFRHSTSGFWYYTMWLFFDLIAAESLTVLLSTVFPIFVIALALTAFVNGLWMSVGGFLVQENVLNVFWYYTFYWIDYQRYVFQGMMFNQFETSVYDCGSNCQCMYSSELQGQCKIAGKAILESLGYGTKDVGLWIGIVWVVIVVMRLATYVVLKLRR